MSISAATCALCEVHGRHALAGAMGLECMATRVLRTPCVLLVNERSDQCGIYARALRSHGYHVVIAATPDAAYPIAVRTPADIVVTDVHVTRSMTGFELARDLRIHGDMRTALIIGLTRGSHRRDGEHALKAGADVFLAKPVSPALLHEQVRRLLVGRAAPVVLRRKRRDGVRRASQHGASGAVIGHAVPRHKQSCPLCARQLVYRRRWPILSVGLPSWGRESRERLRYESGWFCTDPACDYQELVPRRK